MEQNLSAIYKETIHELTPIYGEREAQMMTEILFQDLLQITRTDRILNPNLELSQILATKLEKALDRLLKHEPIQHIIGEAHFYGHVFKVNRHTLIPRPETEELVDLIIKENKQSNLKVLDIGTGTGCIAISLALGLNQPEVIAWDISGEALKVAYQNASQLNAKVKFERIDVLSSNIETQLDIVISNPPYIPKREKSVMSKNVTDYDPELALFVPDEDPLLFYRVIADKSLDSLKDGGRLYFEIHETFGKATVELLSGMDYTDVKLFQDLQGKDRMIRAIKET